LNLTIQPATRLTSTESRSLVTVVADLPLGGIRREADVSDYGLPDAPQRGAVKKPVE
jgi:hypothetical protein